MNPSKVFQGLVTLLVTQGRWVEWERLIADIEAEVTDRSGEPLTGREALWIALLGHRSEIANYRRDFDSEQIILLRLKDHYERVGDERNHATALHQLGRIAQERGKVEEAVRFYEQAEALLVRLNDPYHLEMVRHSLQRVRGGR